MEQLICYAVGQGDDWQAVCVDLDIAVNGQSFKEACEALVAAIDNYIDGGLADSRVKADEHCGVFYSDNINLDCSLNVLDFGVRPL